MRINKCILLLLSVYNVILLSAQRPQYIKLFSQREGKKKSESGQKRQKLPSQIPKVGKKEMKDVLLYSTCRVTLAGLKLTSRRRHVTEDYGI